MVGLQTSGDADAAGDALQEGRRRAQKQVARFYAEQVVDDFEIIDVEEYKHIFLRRVHLHEGRCLAAEIVAVVKPRQRVQLDAAAHIDNLLRLRGLLQLAPLVLEA